MRMRTIGALLAVLTLSFAPLSALHASQETVDPSKPKDTGPAISDSGRRIVLKNANHATPLGVWSAGRRAYGFSEFDLAATSGRKELVSYDLDGDRELARVTLSPPALGDINGSQSDAPSTRPFMAIDQASGVVYVPFRAAPLRNGGQTDAADAGALRICGSQLPPGCFAGVHAVSPDLGDVRSMQFRSIGLDGVLATPRLLAFEFSPARSAGEEAKLHLVLEDWTGQTDSGDAVRHKGVNALYAVQIDAATGMRDWAVRIDACTGTRESSNEHGPTSRQANAATIFRPLQSERQMLYVGCHLPGGIAAVVRVPLQADGFPMALPVRSGDPAGIAGIATAPQNVATVEPATIAAFTEGQRGFPAQAKTVSFYADPAGERVLLKLVGGNPQAEVWLVYDGRRSEYVGTVGIGRYLAQESTSAFDAVTGRLYVLGPKTSAVPGGLYVADIRRTPIPQALSFPELAELAMTQYQPLMAVDTGDERRATRLLVPWRSGTKGEVRLVDDRLPLSIDAASEDTDHRSLDLEEIEGVTAATFDAAARGYGARILLVGGAEALPRFNAVDGTVVLPSVQGPLENATRTAGQRAIGTDCVNKDRSLAIGFVGPEAPVIVDAGGSRGTAEPLVLDDASRNDLDTPASRCLPRDWQELFSLGLWGRPPVDEPQLGWPAGTSAATCLSSSSTDGEGDSDSTGNPGDPVLGYFAAQTNCSDDAASGFAYARGINTSELTVAQALSSFRIYRDPGRGIVARVESVARGVDLGGQVRIDSVRTSAESWANGRRQYTALDDREVGYDPNCDTERTAGSCFARHVFGVRSPVYSCGPCGDEQALALGLETALGASTRVRLRKPDAALAKGAENGFMAAVQKPDYERFADLVLNNDILQTVVPGLEIIRLADGRTGKGRQILHFAGVEVSSTYGIACLLVYDYDTNTCAGEVVQPGGLTVSLADNDGAPLAGGSFEVRRDVDGDGLVGLADTLLADGACVTAADGIGTCRFENLAPGPYLVSQTAAPAGYAVVAEPWLSEVASGETRTVAFTNNTNISVITVKAADEDGKPLSGATFAAYADADADGKIAADAQATATCTTGADGSCQMQVPAGAYVLVQLNAPAGLEGIEPIAFTFASGGQTAAVGVVNYPADAAVPGVAPAAGQAPVYSRQATYSPPVESVSDYDGGAGNDAPVISVPERVGGTVVQIIKAPGDAVRLLARHPMQAIAWVASIAMFLAAGLVVRRRQAAVALTQQR